MNLERAGAVIVGNYRYLLWREWDGVGKTVSFIMLNPGRADAEVRDYSALNGRSLL